MKWEYDEETRFFTAHAGCLSRAEVCTNLAECVVREVLPRNDGLVWDTLRIEYWADSGRIILFLADSARNERIERCGCQVVSSDIAEFYDSLADADIDDEEFTQRVLDYEQDWSRELTRALRTTQLRSKLLFIDGDDPQSVTSIPAQ